MKPKELMVKQATSPGEFGDKQIFHTIRASPARTPPVCMSASPTRPAAILLSVKRQVSCWGTWIAASISLSKHLTRRCCWSMIQQSRDNSEERL